MDKDGFLGERNDKFWTNNVRVCTVLEGVCTVGYVGTFSWSTIESDMWMVKLNHFSQLQSTLSKS